MEKKWNESIEAARWRKFVQQAQNTSGACHRARNPRSHRQVRGESDPRPGCRLTKIIMSFKIHWQEGLFLQPHHLQRMQKSIEDEFAAERRWRGPTRSA
jgi:hypothetical protein